MAKKKSRKAGAHERRKALEEMHTHMQANGYLQGRQLRPSKTGRISERLIDLIMEELDEETDLRTARMLIDLARIAWNLTVEPKEGEEQRQAMRNHLPPDAREFVDEVVEDFKARKLELFPKDLRLVVSTAVHRQSDGGFYFTAAAIGLDDGSGR